MTDHEAFLAAIKANRDDDAPRLVYADWLQEHGEPERAELIRLQCNRLDTRNMTHIVCHHNVICDKCCSCEMCVRSRRALELLNHQPGGRGCIPNRMIWWDGPIIDDIEYQRGFVSYIKLNWGAWLRHADAILAATPLERVELTTWPGHLDTVLEQVVWVLSAEDMADEHGEVTTYADRERLIQGMFARRWPDITFTLPREEFFTESGSVLGIEPFNFTIQGRWDNG